ncbi:hypothetical protein SBA3_2400004 [Candidatus Sulfopaludibacter sp. SbA3]|nr:hypothetical protein SBA3_2400004 [Candidatus Sulfopaludibacter sp. SbA3]
MTVQLPAKPQSRQAAKKKPTAPSLQFCVPALGQSIFFAAPEPE